MTVDIALQRVNWTYGQIGQWKLKFKDFDHDKTSQDNSGALMKNNQMWLCVNLYYSLQTAVYLNFPH